MLFQKLIFKKRLIKELENMKIILIFLNIVYVQKFILFKRTFKLF
jgi:hypothetical protein